MTRFGVVASALVLHTAGIVGMKLYFDVSWREAISYDAPFWIGDVVKTSLVALVAAEAGVVVTGLPGRPFAEPLGIAVAPSVADEFLSLLDRLHPHPARPHQLSIRTLLP